MHPLLSVQASEVRVPGDVLNAIVTVLADWDRSPGGWTGAAPDVMA